ncbi:hypothetical protein NF681_12035 [Comamonadaceae bacterium OTU4NAUVB1]|jgi:hypothetical protein|nr:hypothetical protein NF681_12035 [Comamonadaceae bacterium OTU4NAUVB1]
MNNTELAASIDRLMAHVDYYLHCELDEEYDHDQPNSARFQLQHAIKQELLRASAIGIVTSLTGSGIAAVANIDDFSA